MFAETTTQIRIRWGWLQSLVVGLILLLIHERLVLDIGYRGNIRKLPSALHQVKLSKVNILPSATTCPAPTRQSFNVTLALILAPQQTTVFYHHRRHTAAVSTTAIHTLNNENIDTHLDQAALLDYDLVEDD